MYKPVVWDVNTWAHPFQICKDFHLKSIVKLIFVKKQNNMKPTNPNADTSVNKWKNCHTFYRTHLPRWFDTLVGHSCLTLLRNTSVRHPDVTLLPDTLVGHSYLTLLWDTLTWHSCGTLLLDTLLKYSDLTRCKTFALHTLIWHSCGTLLLDTLLRHSYLALLLDTHPWHFYKTLLLDTLSWHFCRTQTTHTDTSSTNASITTAPQTTRTDTSSTNANTTAAPQIARADTSSANANITAASRINLTHFRNRPRCFRVCGERYGGHANGWAVTQRLGSHANGCQWLTTWSNFWQTQPCPQTPNWNGNPRYAFGKKTFVRLARLQARTSPCSRPEEN